MALLVSNRMTNDSEMISDRSMTEQNISSSQNRDDLCTKDIKGSVHKTSLHGGTILMSELKSAIPEQVTDMVVVDLKGLKLNAENWAKFQSLTMISAEGKNQFLSDIVNDMIQHILYENPELFNSYVEPQPLRPAQ